MSDDDENLHIGFSSGWPGAMVGIAFFAMIAIGIVSCNTVTREPLPNFQCPEGFAPEYYENVIRRKFNCVRAEVEKPSSF